VDECKPLVSGWKLAASVAPVFGELTKVRTRGLHSFTSQLNSSAFHGIGGVRKGLCSPYQWGVRGCLECVG